jgi:hypothetical protein
MIRYVNERVVSKITGLALQTLRNHRFQKRGIPYSRIGRSIRYSMEDIINFMERRKIQTEDSLSKRKRRKEDVKAV